MKRTPQIPHISIAALSEYGVSLVLFPQYPRPSAEHTSAYPNQAGVDSMADSLQFQLWKGAIHQTLASVVIRNIRSTIDYRIT